MPHTGLTVTETAPRGLTRTARVPVHAPALGPRRVRQTTRVLVPFFAARNNVAVSGWTTFRVPILIPRTPGADSDKRGWRARPFSCARASAAAGPRAGAASRPGHNRAHACATVQVTAALTRVRRCLAVSICISRGQRIWSIA